MSGERSYQSGYGTSPTPAVKGQEFLFRPDSGVGWNSLPVVDLDATEVSPLKTTTDLMRRLDLWAPTSSPRLGEYRTTLRILRPSSLSELRIAHDGFMNRILRVPDPSRSSMALYELIESAHAFRADASNTLRTLPKPETYGQDPNMLARFVRDNPDSQARVADYLLRVDQVKQFKWLNKTRNGQENITLRQELEQKVQEVLSYDDSALARLCELARGSDYYRYIRWDGYLQELDDIQAIDVTKLGDPRAIQQVSIVQSKMASLKRVIEDYRPVGEYPD